MFRYLLITAVFLAAIGAPAAQGDEVRVDGVHIAWAGIYRVESTVRLDDPSKVTGKVSQSQGFTLVKETDLIPALKDVRFGIQFELIGEPKGAIVDIQLIKRFPTGITNPSTGKTVHESKVDLQVVMGESEIAGYWLTNDWEVVPGDWRFEISYQGRTLGEKVFHLRSP
jgi:hypothetical protein